jgi:hypothetical protein
MWQCGSVVDSCRDDAHNWGQAEGIKHCEEQIRSGWALTMCQSGMLVVEAINKLKHRSAARATCVRAETSLMRGRAVDRACEQQQQPPAFSHT